MDQVQTYRVWVENHAEADRYVYLASAPDQILKVAYLVSNDGVRRAADPVYLGSLDATDVGGWIVVFDTECRELDRAPIGPGKYFVELLEASIRIELPAAGATDPAAERLASTPLTCR